MESRSREADDSVLVKTERERNFVTETDGTLLAKIDTHACRAIASCRAVTQ